MKRLRMLLLYAVASALFQIATAPGAFADPILGTAGNFAVLAGSTITNTGATTLTGDLGLSPGTSYTVTGSVSQTGTVHLTDAAALLAQSDLTIAYNDLASVTPTSDLTGQDLGGQTLTSGVYFFSSSAQLTGALTLNAQGDANAFWIFQIGSTLTTASDSAVNIIGGSGNNAVYWQVGSSATLGTTTSFQGSIVALTSITLNTGATIDCGRALARNGAVTMDSNTITSSGCAGSAGNIVIIPGDDDDEGGPGTGTGTVKPVPEPGTLLLLGSGIASLMAGRARAARGRQRNQTPKA